MKRIENPYIKQLLDSKRILISYVRNSYGEKKGVAIAYLDEQGDLRVGASQIHPYDYDTGVFNLNDMLNLPAIQKFLKKRPGLDIYLDELQLNFPKFFNNYVIRQYPSFDREKGIVEAIRNAKDSNWHTYDEDVSNAYVKMLERGESYFQKVVRFF